MSRAQRQRASEAAALRALLQKFRANPRTLPAHVVDDLLGDLDLCLTPEDHEFVLANPPTDPLAFAELVARLEYGGSDAPEFVEMILPLVLRTFEGAAGDGGDDDATEPLE